MNKNVNRNHLEAVLQWSPSVFSTHMRPTLKTALPSSPES